MEIAEHKPKPCANEFCFSDWQDISACCQHNKLHSIYSTVRSIKHSKILLFVNHMLLTGFETSGSKGEARKAEALC